MKSTDDDVDTNAEFQIQNRLITGVAESKILLDVPDFIGCAPKPEGCGGYKPPLLE
jgi:hypothetical protein